MAQQEICQIVEKVRETFSTNFSWWEAHQVSPQGIIIVAKSDEFTHPSQEKGYLGQVLGSFLSNVGKENQIWEERRRAANSQVIAPLLAQGWEVGAVNSDGLITMVKRTSEG